MLFKEVKFLASRGPIEQREDSEVRGTLLVGESPVGEWQGKTNWAGHDNVRIFPAYHDGKQAWLVEEVWSSALGYSCSGLTDEYVIDFETGVKMLLEHGAYNGIFITK